MQLEHKVNTMYRNFDKTGKWSVNRRTWTQATHIQQNVNGETGTKWTDYEQ